MTGDGNLSSEYWRRGIKQSTVGEVGMGMGSWHYRSVGVVGI